MSYFNSLEFHEHVIDAAESIAPLPDGMVRLTELAADPTATVNDVSEVVMDDVGLATAILREANSAAVAAADPIETVQAAVVRLGTARVVAIAMSASLGDTLPDRLNGYDAETAQFWLHARAATVVAESVVALGQVDFGGGLITAALIQNIGAVVLDPFIPAPAYPVAFRMHGDQAAAERELIDVDHGLVGATICRHWKLPEAMCRAVEHHHALDASAPEAALALHVTDCVVAELVPGVAERGVVTTNHGRFETALDALGIDDRAVLMSHAADRLRARDFTVEPIENQVSA